MKCYPCGYGTRPSMDCQDEAAPHAAEAGA